MHARSHACFFVDITGLRIPLHQAPRPAAGTPTPPAQGRGRHFGFQRRLHPPLCRGVAFRPHCPPRRSLPGLSQRRDLCWFSCGIRAIAASALSQDTVVSMVTALGPGSRLAKVDIEAAYRLVPVHPDDRPLLGIRWEGKLYCSAMLSFGLRSAAKIFNALADALEWIIRSRGVSHVAHYLDDFVVVGAPSSPQCADDLRTLESTCRELGVPLAVAKCVAPTTQLTFLGIEINSIAGSIRLPLDKLSRIQASLCAWGDKETCRRRELGSLIGLLHHACKVVRPGRLFSAA